MVIGIQLFGSDIETMRVCVKLRQCRSRYVDINWIYDSKWLAVEQVALCKVIPKMNFRIMTKAVVNSTHLLKHNETQLEFGTMCSH
jgi:hypothetical protein